MLCSNDNTKASRHLSLLALSLALLIPLLVAPSAHAVLLQYSFSGFAGTGSSIDLGPGSPVDISGSAFTASGQTIDDVDLSGSTGDAIGLFAATTTYDFGVSGAFHTDLGMDFYAQDCDTPSSIGCVGLVYFTPYPYPGFAGFFTPVVSGDPDFGIPIGTVTPYFTDPVTRTQVNSLGHILVLEATGLSLSSITVTAIPEPATLALMGFGLIGLTGARRKIKK